MAVVLIVVMLLIPRGLIEELGRQRGIALGLGDCFPGGPRRHLDRCAAATTAPPHCPGRDTRAGDPRRSC